MHHPLLPNFIINSLSGLFLQLLVKNSLFEIRILEMLKGGAWLKENTKLDESSCCFQTGYIVKILIKNIKLRI